MPSDPRRAAALIEVVDDVPLAPLSTLELGGVARHLVEARDEGTLAAALHWAETRRLPVVVLGGGSNVVVDDAGFDGLVIRMALRGVRVEYEGGMVVVEAAAGEPWDDLVATAVAEGWAGLECLAGIPGTAGATPIQNVGAYGQEIAGSVRAVRALDRACGDIVELTPAACAFAYRDSVFRRAPGRFVVLAVRFSLQPGAAGIATYPELCSLLGATAAPLAAVRDAVLDLRRRKSMVLDPGDENRRSVGSFFVNPTVAAEAASEIVRRAVRLGVAPEPGTVPVFPVAGGAKLSAAWLVEHAGFPRGLRRGTVGISSRHCLALVHHGGGRTSDLLDLAREIRAGVRDRFGVTLTPEPVFLGFSDDPLK
jgi:UDP-N-acetylmuramate dehydrogenase